MANSDLYKIFIKPLCHPYAPGRIILCLTTYLPKLFIRSPKRQLDEQHGGTNVLPRDAGPGRIVQRVRATHLREGYFQSQPVS